MLRVGFLFHGGEGWLGGVNYLWNLLFAIGRHEGKTVRPVVLARADAKLFGLDVLEGVEVIRSPLRPWTRWDFVARTAERRLLGTDAHVETIAREARLDVLSHSGTFGWRFALPTTPWIADLQHRRLPRFFSASERAQRIYGDTVQLFEGTQTIFSSEAAEADARRYYGPLARRSTVLHFVSQPRLARDQLPHAVALRARYALPERYFFLPNQFWRHKNHMVVVDALSMLASRGERPTVILTGKGEDYRAPRHYAGLVAEVARRGLETQFRHLGMVPFEDLAALMRDACAVLNPSYFEGWSTTVEEARSLGKAMILSDIDVHREQAPPGATYFPPDDAAKLADRMSDAWVESAPDVDRAREMRADSELPARTAAFAARYRLLVEEAAARRPPAD